ncbi:MAG: MlaD family protein [Acidobacteria bacterium]|nr:MlaD family protein [Acidobacteriota bacterium]
MPSAERISWAKTRVVITGMVAVAILGVLVYLLAGTKFFIPKVMLRTYLSETEGLEGGAPVLLNGIRIGWVSRIGLSGLKEPSKVLEIRMIIDARFLPEIPVDSTTEVTSENMLGDQYLEINRGRSKVHVQRGGVLPPEPPSGLLSRIDLPTFEKNLKSIDALLKDIQDGKGSFGELVVGDKFYRDVLFKVTRLQQSLHAARTKGIIGRLIYTDELYEKLARPAMRLDAQLADIQAGRGTAGEWIRSPKKYADLSAKIDEVQRIVDRFGNSPFVSKDDLYVSWNGKVASLIRSVDELNSGRGTAGRFLANAQLYESLNGAMRELGAQVNDFRLNPKKYLRTNMHLF